MAFHISEVANPANLNLYGQCLQHCVGFFWPFCRLFLDVNFVVKLGIPKRLVMMILSPYHQQSGPQPDLDIAKWRPRRETRAKVTSWLFAAPRIVVSPYYFESCDFRQWEIRGVKKKCRPMNVCALLGGKTIEHESFSAQRNARQGAKHRKKKGECDFLDHWKNFLEIYIKFACW